MGKVDDRELRQKVIDELDWDPAIDASGIGVAAQDGVITLSGCVPSFPQRKAAEQAAKRVKGVRAVAEDLAVRLSGTDVRSDAEIAAAVLTSLQSNVSIPHAQIVATVEDGWVTLEGGLPWQFQRDAAENVVRHTVGVKGVLNRIVVKPAITAEDVRAKIEAAFARRAQAEAEQIRVEFVDDKVVLKGVVRSWEAKDAAEQAAWSAPGVAHVENDVLVNPL